MAQPPGRTTTPTQALIICAAAWAVPGAGHFWLGQVQKGLSLLVLLTVLFTLGLWIEGRLFPFDFTDPRNFEYAMTLRNLETLIILDMLLRNVMY